MTETRVLVQCDGAAVPDALAGQRWSHQRPLNSRGPSADLNLRAQSLASTVLTRIESRAADLVRIASYVYAADQVISRGGDADVYGRKWRRHFALCIPVSNPAFWMQEEVRSSLSLVLLFLTEDNWEFHFSTAPEQMRQLPLDVNDPDILGTPDTVVLFSGGADSLCTAIGAVVDQGQRPLLVSHRSAPNLNARQSKLAALLRDRFPHWEFPHLSFWIHRKGSDAADTSQRSRAFLFACIGAAAAAELGISQVLLGDNGIVSLNLPISAQLVGALASRSTHPRFIYHFNELLAHVFPQHLELSNPLRTRTHAEVLGILQGSGCAPLLQEFVSCSRSRGRPAVTPHCGYCSQCVDRRFGSVAAGLEAHDLGERYQVDIFVDSLLDGEPRTIGESYVRFARQVQNTHDEELFLTFPQLHDCILPIDTAPESTAHELAGLLKRHAVSVLNVTSMMVARHSRGLVQGAMPENSLLRLVIGPSGRSPLPSETDENVIRLDGQQWTIAYRGVSRTFNQTKGLSYIARLLTHPGREFHALDLAQDRAIIDGPADHDHLARLLPDTVISNSLTIEVLDGHDEMLDDQARREYREHIARLRKQRETLLASGHQERIAAIDDEIAQIEGALRTATGIGGRRRTFNSSTERARKSVSRNIHRSLKTIANFHPQLHRHLVACLGVGAFCSYNPDSPMKWTST